MTALKAAASTGSETAQAASLSAPPNAAVDSARFDVLVSHSCPITVVISLVGDHEDYAAGAFARMAQGELPHCERLVMDFSLTTKLGADVIDALIDVAGHARTHGCALQIVTREYTFAHDILELAGILDRLDHTDRLPA